MSTAAVVAACLIAGAQAFNVPVDVMLGIYEVEGGAIGRESALNKNGTRDLGLWQINEHWLPDLAKAWNRTIPETRAMIRDDGCVNVITAAFVLRTKINAAGGDLMKGIAWYNSANPTYGIPYRAKVLTAMERHKRLAMSNGSK